ncbi:hypothetical protein IQ238_19780 [Pleurocapsales cyanobacterium LEGE 06147]|nr:hypothetical protein [Pleurocapsales cyanobacterium LEGE 06147]
MSGQMCWLSNYGTEGEKILHLRLESHQPWKPYKAYPQYAVADYLIPGGTKGWATYQHLRKAGWTLIPTAQAYQILETATS